MPATWAAWDASVKHAPSVAPSLGLLIFAFYFTSNILLYYQHLLINMEQRTNDDETRL